METYQTLAPAYVELLQKAIGNKNRLEYFNEYREYKLADSPLKQLITNEKGEFLELATGQTIPLNQIISLNSIFFPGYEDYQEVLSVRCSR
ncbi:MULTISPECIES: hypothetical protein [unclassified Siphonobacter]|uniref:hypothetical protein n=1 Tax=unclassified Siphonobacter TaxID=2635712 RepID=UPI000CADDD53|nr:MULTISPECIES: hypothetical protein [unclassified Siphonobacter]MDQ1088242.1 hypothetical protein [Siphonobacter sp. SORGH_AS_1065]MDR6194387.1 hypothetical protein [Siphonobacter sp. SORGH_AS_0500]PKK37687.1 hypothetical protein BWI96_04250 [Siphonobacter sp. SORGH_AS_0500]